VLDLTEDGIALANHERPLWRRWAKLRVSQRGRNLDFGSLVEPVRIAHVADFSLER